VTSIVIRRGFVGASILRGGDGKEVLYAKRDAIFAVGVDPASGKPTGAPELLFRRTTAGRSPKWPDGFAVTRDGQGFIVAENLLAEDAAAITSADWRREIDVQSGGLIESVGVSSRPTHFNVYSAQLRRSSVPRT